MSTAEPDCPAREVLSAYVDREANPSEERRVDLHLADCPECRRRVRALARLKTAVRNQPAPSLPPELRRELGRMADEALLRRGTAGWVAARLGELREAASLVLRRPAAAVAFAAALVLAVWSGTRLGRGRVVVPVDLILAAHNQYARTMPLAPTEQILSELPVQISYGREVREGAGVY